MRRFFPFRERFGSWHVHIDLVFNDLFFGTHFTYHSTVTRKRTQMKTISAAAFTTPLFTALVFMAGVTRTSAQEASRTNNSQPVLLMNFEGKTDNNNGELTWTMENQTNCKWFVIERSANAVGFDSIGVVSGTNNTHSTDYSFTDERMLSGNNFYRLRQVDNDGVSKYSKIIGLYNASKTVAVKKMQLYPNPATSMVNYTLNSSATARATVQVYNMAGVLVLTQQQQLATGINQQSVAISTLKSGNYFLKVSSQDGALYEQTFVKLL